MDRRQKYVVTKDMKNILHFFKHEKKITFLISVGRVLVHHGDLQSDSQPGNGWKIQVDLTFHRLISP